MKRFTITVCLVGLLLSACLPQPSSAPVLPPSEVTPTLDNPTPPAAPTFTTEPSATVPPALAEIAPQTAGGLVQTAQAAVETPNRLVWSADGSVLGVLWTHTDSATGTSSACISLLDGASLQSLAEYALPAPGVVFDLSPDGRTAAVSSDMLGVQLLDVYTGEVLQTLIPAHRVQAASFTPDGVTIGLVSADAWQVTQFDVAGGQQTTPLTGFETASPVYSARFAPDGRTLIWWARGMVQLMDVGSGQLRAALGHEDFVMALALSHDGTRLATAAGGTLQGQFLPLVYLWNAADSTLAAVLEQPAVSTALAFSPDGALLASAAGTQVLLWDVAAQSQTGVLSGPTESIADLAFSPDGASLAAAAWDGTVRLWRVTE